MKNLNANTITLQGRHIIEASAGTGKTFNITKIYIRLLLEKKLLPNNILVMTFTKDATQEIIGRVEGEIRDVLNDISNGKEVEVSIKGNDTLIQKADENYKHLKRALLEIDEAAIFTIHGFCKKVLSEQAFASGMEMDVSMEVDTSDILQKVVEDFFRKNINKNKTNFEYLKAYKLHTPEKFLDRNGLLNVIRSNYEILSSKEVLVDDIYFYKKDIKTSISSNLNAEIRKYITQKGFDEAFERVLTWLESKDITIPSDVYLITKGNLKAVYKNLVSIPLKELIGLIDDYNNFMQSQFIKQSCLKIRQDFAKAKEQKGVLDFDDLITKLCQSVKNSPDLVKTLQAQYPVALIDEFQDTDAEQYQILDTIYPKDREDLLLLMIGDPKQAIYGFRGGDIFTYLKAKNSCPEENKWSMDTNWRSTSEMIKAYNRLFYKEDYEAKDEGKHGEDIFSKGIGYQLVKASPKANEKARDFADGLKPINYFYYEVSEEDKKNDIDKNLSAWTANEIVRLLNSKKVAENDIAILVENGTQAKEIQQALSNKKLSSVYLSQRDNVYHSQEATEILAVMEGINELENKSLLKKALSTSLLGGSADKFIKYTDDDDISAWDEEIEKAKNLRMKWHKYGFMAFIMRLIHESFSQRDDSKQRTITNILHLAELIKVAENKYKHPNQLIKWYRQEIKSSSTAEGELRLESDDNLIKIITIHGSKGLEYSVVFIPFASYTSSKKLSLNNANKYYDDNLKQTVYKVGKDDTTKKLVEQETIQELMRLFYVAVTRAEHRCYIGVAKYQSKKGGAKVASDDSFNSPLAQFLGYEKDESWLEKVQKITANPDNQSLLLEINNFEALKLNNLNKTEVNQQLKANEIAKLKDDNWEMLSFSKISKSKAQNTALEKENDESEDSEVQESQDELEFRFTAPKGADMGNILHNLLEHTDFSAGFIDDTLLQEQMGRYRVVAAEDFDNLKTWLEECLVAEIKPIKNSDTSESSSKSLNSNEDIQYSLFDNNGEKPKQSQHNANKKSFCLKDIPNSKTLKEAEFYFPITNEKLYKNNIIKILEEYRNNSIMVDELSNYKIFGMLHGFIDLVFEYDGKFYVADYKSNYLGDKLEDYNQQTMQEKNQSSFYDLQYLIYSVALNKYLKQNIPNYNFEKHFGGVYYFYLRGMKNGYGIYQASPSFGIISKLSNLLNGGSNV
ncbi:UvrD-helicase domain-containing protein [Francisella sp. LA112445]|uniref:UvrD-helicase domain-containing protein n=1 Tax=Francisella sp. LA112445 TaxID=1395624 RepID=UPI001788B0D4|nr:UvrD-helicase domain-containing protein [Francisella sp. LA112445]QIW10564.1 exodeoxyribonuclease V subunit beta [Francisella sp. LA112445]